MKTKTTARKRTAQKPAATAPDAAPKLKAEVHIHPAKLEIFDHAGNLTDRLANGAPGSDAHEKNARIIAGLHESYAVTIRKFNAQGAEL